MRDAIDPVESEYYQTILWIADERPRHFERWQQQPWIGARWRHATQAQLPSTNDSATTLVMVQDLHESHAEKFVSSLISLETQGDMLGAIVVRNPYKAWLVDRAWRRQVAPSAENIPLIIAVDTSADGYACLRLLNQFTYAAMLVCADWFDVRIASTYWNRPHRYRHISADNIEEALAQFSQAAVQGRLISLALLLTPEPDLDSFGRLLDAAESQACDKVSPLVTSLFCTTDTWASEIHWLEPFSEDASSLKPPPVTKSLCVSDEQHIADTPPSAGIFWLVFEELVFHIIPADEAINIDWNNYQQEFWRKFSPETPDQEFLKTYDFDYFPRGRVAYFEEIHTFVVHADRHLEKPDIRKTIKAAFGLPDASQFHNSSFYRCMLCRDEDND